MFAIVLPYFVTHWSVYVQYFAPVFIPLTNEMGGGGGGILESADSQFSGWSVGEIFSLKLLPQFSKSYMYK